MVFDHEYDEYCSASAILKMEDESKARKVTCLYYRLSVE